MVSSLPTQSEQPKRRSNDPISWYLQNIGRVPLLTPAEEIELGNQVQKWFHPYQPKPNILKGEVMIQ